METPPNEHPNTVWTGAFTRSATHLSGFFECKHKTWRQMGVTEGKLTRPPQNDIERRLLEMRGQEHEAAVLQHFREKGLRVVTMARAPASTPQAREHMAAETLAAMSSGADVIHQGLLRHGQWQGYPDFLLKTAGASRFGSHAYEIGDAKLARTAKAHAIVQLCVYSECLSHAQDAEPERFYIFPGGAAAEPIAFRLDDYAAYHRRAKTVFDAFVSGPPSEPYPEPAEHCNVCEWWAGCENQRRQDDHLSLVANITRRQRERLVAASVKTTTALAHMVSESSVPGIESSILQRLAEQAALQVKGRGLPAPIYDLLTQFEPGTGLERLPLPTPGDLFFDIEGDSFAFGTGIDYLLGVIELGQPDIGFVERKAPGPPRYLKFWATSPNEERQSFQALIKRIADGLLEFPSMHIYHFGHRESDALKTLACRHGVGEDTVDRLLKEHVLVDLHRITKQALRASVEQYSLKQLEGLYGFTRQVSKRDAAKAMQMFGWWLEVGGDDPELPSRQETIQRYNEEDCLSTLGLRDWLEARRSDLSALLGREVSRWSPPDDKATPPPPPRVQAEQLARALTAGIVGEPAAGSEQYAKRLLADLLQWHWREQKSGYWEHYGALDVGIEDRMESRLVLAELAYEGNVGEIKRSIIHRYRFDPNQDHVIRRIPGAVDADTKKEARIHAIGRDFIDLLRDKKLTPAHPTALVPKKPINTPEQVRRLLALADSVVRFGLDRSESADFPAARALLDRVPPTCGQAEGAPLMAADANPAEELPQLAVRMQSGVLAVQGPPGAGKTYCAAECVVALLRSGRKVGITANSHQVIKTLLSKALDACQRAGVGVKAHRLTDDDDEECSDVYSVGKNYDAVATDLAAGRINLVGGTTFAWSREQFDNSVDVLIVDEAGQISLANALAVASAAKSLILVGDPRQLDQPQKGVHPRGADVSALEHWLGDAITMPPDRGVLLRETRRLHPSICEFTSQTFYEGKLHAAHDQSLQRQSVSGPHPFAGSGLRFVP